MTQENKDLLLKDLCARLPYGVKVQDELGRINKMVLGNSDLGRLYYNDFSTYSENKLSLPYLFPLSSMTEEQKYEYDELIHSNNIKAIEGFITSTDCSTAEIDWLLKNHFDYRGLIPNGLAIDATGLNIY